MSVEMPRSLRAVVRARRAGWRLRVAPANVLGVLGPVVWALVLVSAVVLATVGVVFGLSPIMTLLLGDDLAEGIGGLIMLPISLMTGTACVLGARSLIRAAARFAVGFHRIDLRPATAPTRIVLTGWLHRSVVDVADISRVIVRYCESVPVSFGEPALQLVVRTGHTTLVCPALVVGPLRSADPRMLAVWLGEVLGPLEIPVSHYRATHSLEVREAWLPADSVARVWWAPVEEVPALADHFGVYTKTEPNTRTFNVYDVEACAERARAIMSGDQHEP
ncbi:MAG: hypothetical protein ABW215_06030 [Kibdelosporangium sp.]